MFRLRIIYILCSLCCSSWLYAQDLSSTRLETLEYEELLTLFDEVQRDSVSAEKVARAYLNRARKEGDTIKMARGYDRLARVFHPQKGIAFADSIIQLTTDFNHMTYPAMGYMLKSYHYGTLDNLIDKTENINQLFFSAKKNNNIAHELYALHVIIINKSFWGDKDEAIEIQKYRKAMLERSSLYDDLKRTSRKEYEDKVPDLIKENKILSLYTDTFCNLNIEKYDLANDFLMEAELLNSKYFGAYKTSYNDMIQTVQLEIHFYKNEEDKFFILQQELLARSSVQTNKNSLFDIFGYTGLFYFKFGNYKLGEKYLLKSDSINKKFNLSLLPYQRNFIQGLLDYNIWNKNKEGQLEYYKQLNKIDSVFKINFKYFESEVTNRIEVPMLLREKELEISSLQEKQKESKVFISWLWMSVVVFFIAVMLLIRKHLLYRKRVQRLINQTSELQLQSSISKQEENLSELTSEMVKEIMDKLEHFEQSQKFRNPEINLHNLAKRFKTNARYLSKVVNFKKENNFPQYLNELRVNYSVEALRNDPNYRKYTIKAIAELSGFSSAESYSRTFKKKFGIHPSYFIRELLKNKGYDSFGDDPMFAQNGDE